MKYFEKTKTYIYIALSLGLGIFLLLLIAAFFSFKREDFYFYFKRIKPFFVGLVFLSTVFNFWITSKKWQIVTSKLVDAPILKGKFFIYTAVMIFLGQFIPPQLSFAAVRSVALQVHDNMPISKGIVSTVYDQLFDLLIPVILLIPFFLILLKKITIFTGLFISVISLVLIGTCVSLIGRSIIEYISTLTINGPIIGKAWNRIILSARAHVTHPLLDAGFIRTMFILSVCKYVNLLLRVWFVALAINVSIPLIILLFSMPVISLSFLLNITPAGIGITEWGWVGVLSLLNIPTEISVHFALFSRLLVILCIIGINCLLVVYFPIRKIMHRGYLKQ